MLDTKITIPEEHIGHYRDTARYILNFLEIDISSTQIKLYYAFLVRAMYHFSSYQTGDILIYEHKNDEHIITIDRDKLFEKHEEYKFVANEVKALEDRLDQIKKRKI